MDYQEEKDANAALTALNDKDFCGRPLKVEWSRASNKFDDDDRAGARS